MVRRNDESVAVCVGEATGRPARAKGLRFRYYAAGERPADFAVSLGTNGMFGLDPIVRVPRLLPFPAAGRYERIDAVLPFPWRRLELRTVIQCSDGGPEDRRPAA